VTGAQLERLATVLGVDPSRVAHCNSEEHYSSRFAPAIRASLNVVSALVAKQRGAQGGVRISVAVPATVLLTAGGQWHAALQLVSPHINADTLSTTANADPDDRLRSVALSIAGAGSWQAVMRLLAGRTPTTSLTAMSKECALAALLGYPGDRDAFELYLRSGRRKYNSTGGDGPASAHMMVANWGTLKPLFVGADAVTPTVIQFAALAMLLGSKRLSDSAETAAFRRNIAATVAVPMLEALAPAIASARRVRPSGSESARSNATRRTQAEVDAELAAAACDRVVGALAVRRGEATHIVPGVAAHAEWCTAVALAAMTITHGFHSRGSPYAAWSIAQGPMGRGKLLWPSRHDTRQLCHHQRTHHRSTNSRRRNAKHILPRSTPSSESRGFHDPAPGPTHWPRCETCSAPEGLMRSRTPLRWPSCAWRTRRLATRGAANSSLRVSLP
jgi:hypothetical protein